MAKAKQNKPTSKLKVFSLGGLEEVGKNITVLEYENDIIVIDCGMGFPDDEMPGVDFVIPDVTYLEKNAEKVRGIFITHGHEDHIGALPYVLRDIHVPVYATRLTLGILRNKLSEHSYDVEPELIECKPGDIIRGGVFSVEFIHVNHSIADACAFAIRTPVGTVVHTGDFKIDLTPIDGAMIDLPRLGAIGNEGVLLLMCESTNAERPGYTPSEKNVGASLEDIFFRNQDKRIVIATFSSNVHRVQQIIDTSAKYNRKVAITGRSMLNVVSAAIELGYMTVPANTIIDLNEIKKYNPEQLTVITTGSQGEPMSALSRMAYADHDKVELGPKDLVVISASPIPGNEKLVGRVINELTKKRVSVIHSGVADVHVSGHACQEEIKMMHALLRPKYFMPIHGEDRHLGAHKTLAEAMGLPADHIFVSEIGRVLELDQNSAKFNGTVPAGRVLVDGYGVGDVGNIVLRDRRHLAQDGLIVIVATIDTIERTIISGPDVVSRGFVYVREAEELMEEVRSIAAEAIQECFESDMLDWNHIKGAVKDDLTKYLYQKTKRKPMILPVIMNV
ncbi:MAG: ribonuclease J [Clostridia bacterium]|nr:ribonuclease J [Clostridia bacterium]